MHLITLLVGLLISFNFSYADHSKQKQERQLEPMEKNTLKAWNKAGFTPEILLGSFLNPGSCIVDKEFFRGCYFAASAMAEKIYGKNHILSVRPAGYNNLYESTGTMIGPFFLIKWKDIKLEDVKELSDYNKERAVDSKLRLEDIDAFYEKYLLPLKPSIRTAIDTYVQNTDATMVKLGKRSKFFKYIRDVHLSFHKSTSAIAQIRERREQTLSFIQKAKDKCATNDPKACSNQKNLEEYLGGVDFQLKRTQSANSIAKADIYELINNDIEVASSPLETAKKYDAYLKNNDWKMAEIALSFPFEVFKLVPKNLTPMFDIFKQVFDHIPQEEHNFLAGQYFNKYASSYSDGHASLMLEYSFEQKMTQGGIAFYGIGAHIVEFEGRIHLKPLKGGQADNTGFLSNDAIIEIDGKEVKKDEPIDEVRSKLIGAEGTPLLLKVKRWDSNEVYENTIIRKPVKPASINFDIKQSQGKQIGYIQVRAFDLHNLDTKLAEFISAHNDKVHGWVVDLQSNPGGLKSEVEEMLDLFYPANIPLVGEGKNKVSTETIVKTTARHLTKKPVAVVINAGSASASEIFSGVIQENKRGIIVGETSFGKGSVQSPLNSHPVIRQLPFFSHFPKLMYRETSSRYFFASGRSPEWVGVTPDIPVRINPEAEDFFKLREKDIYPISLKGVSAEWVQPRPNYIASIKECADTSGEALKKWKEDKRPYKTGFRVLFALDVVACM